MTSHSCLWLPHSLRRLLHRPTDNRRKLSEMLLPRAAGYSSLWRDCYPRASVASPRPSLFAAAITRAGGLELGRNERGVRGGKPPPPVRRATFSGCASSPLQRWWPLPPENVEACVEERPIRALVGSQLAVMRSQTDSNGGRREKRYRIENMTVVARIKFCVNLNGGYGYDL